MHDTSLLGGLARDRHLVPNLAELLPGARYEMAWQAFLDERFAESLDLIKDLILRCLAREEAEDPSSAPISPKPETPCLRDGIILWARNLYHLDRFDEFRELQHYLGRQLRTQDAWYELEVIELEFAYKRGEYGQVVETAGAFIEEHRHNLPPVLADYLYVRGLCLNYLGDSEGARQDAEAAYALFNVLGKGFEGSRAANLLGALHFRAADFKAAKHWFFRSLDMNRRLGRHKRVASNRLNIGIACYKQGDLQQALAELAAADEIINTTTQGITQCRVSIARGNVYRMLREFEAARAELLPAYEKANGLERPREEALALEFIGDVLRDEGEVAMARRYYSRALAIGRSLAPEGDIVMEVMRRQGECLDLLGRPTEALPVLGRALTLARRLGDVYEEGVIQRILAEVMLSMGDHDAAAHHSEQSCANLRRIGAEFELAQALLVAANTRLARLDSGLADEAEALLKDAWQDAMAALGMFLKRDVEHHILAARQMLHTISRRRADQEDKSPREPRLNGEPQSASDRNDAIIHVSSRMRDLVQLCDAFADSLEPVLITGSTGTGKELFARRLHRQSSRRAKEIVCVNVAAIPGSLFEREFFGHVRGAFSGAESDSRGLAAQADGGTLFLDEIGELPLASQPKLLRLLQEGTFQAIGDPTERRTDIRLVAATNANLGQLVAEGKFRADLYYRLKILELKLPEITERREDILPLLRHFLKLAAGRPVELNEVFNQVSLEMLQHRYSWPGNVREIAMVARQAWVQLTTRGKVNVELGSDREEVACLTGPHRVPGQELLPHSVKGEAFRSRLLLALADTSGNRAEAARRLGISRSTLYRQMEKLGVASR